MKITAREIHLEIKHGLTPDELAQKCGMESEEELFSYIRTKMSCGANELIRELQKNEKRKERRAKSRTPEKEHMSADEVPEENPATETTDIPETFTEEAQEEVPEENSITDTTETPTTITEETQEEVQEEPRATSDEEKLVSLKETEAELSSELIDLEKSHEAMARRRHDIIEKAKTLSERVLEIQNELLSKQVEIEELILEYEVLAEDMIRNTSNRREYEEVLDEVRSEIDALKQFTVMVKADGTIETNRPELSESFTPETEQAEVAKVLCSAESDSLTGKQIKAIAKARLLKALGAQVTCELDEFNNFFEED